MKDQRVERAILAAEAALREASRQLSLVRCEHDLLAFVDATKRDRDAWAAKAKGYDALEESRQEWQDEAEWYRAALQQIAALDDGPAARLARKALADAGQGVAAG